MEPRASTFSALIACALLATSCDDSTPPGGVDAAAGVDAPAVDAASTPDAPAAAGGATWMLAPNPTCTATVSPVCIDTGVQGGYQLAAGAACPLNNNLSIYLPGGSVPAAGTYTVKPVATVSDVVNLTAGQIVVRSVFHPTGTTQEDWYAQSGSVTVTNVGGKLGYTLVNLPTQKLGAATMTALSATASCP